MSRPRQASLPGRFLAGVESAGLLPEGAAVLVAVSGGADSVCLLELLRIIAPRLGLRLHGFHLNHRLRPGATGDEAFVRALFATARLPLAVFHSDVAGFARRHRLGIEEAGRELRYRYMARAALREGCSRVALGHTADDNLETIVLNLARGTGLAGLRGIPPARLPYVRPLLEFTRAELEPWLRSRGREWREDESNADEAYSRNLVRHRVVPVLRELNPAVAAAALRAGRQVAEDDDYLDGLARSALSSAVRRTRAGLEIDPDAVVQYNICLGKRMVRQLIPGLDSRAVERVLAFFSSSSVRLQPVAGVTLSRRAGSRTVAVAKKGRDGREA